MLDLRADDCEKVVGLRQVLRHAAKHELSAVFIASDADGRIRSEVKRVCLEGNIPMLDAEDMLTLGDICGIKVGAAAVGIKK